MLTVATVLWDANPTSFAWSRDYSPMWVIKLRNQFARHLTVPHRFVCYVDHFREGLPFDINQHEFDTATPSYIDCLQPFEMGEPMILVGLDTVILRNIDHLADWVLDNRRNEYVIGLPRDPFYSDGRACNGVVLAPGRMQRVWEERDRASNDDMMGCRRWPHRLIDDLFPGSVVSYKGHVLGQSAIHWEDKLGAIPKGIDGVDIVYFHGRPKQPDLMHLDWVAAAWR